MHPLTRAEYLEWLDGKPSTDKAMREFLESHGEAVDPKHFKAGHLLAPYWDRVEARLRAA
jgi:hypothetical protein